LNINAPHSLAGFPAHNLINFIAVHTRMVDAMVFEHTWKVYTRHFALISIMAVPGLFGLLIPLLVGTPSFVALGGSYLRTESLLDLSPAAAGFTIVALLVSLYLMSFAVVNINLVVKSSRTLTQVRNEAAKSITTTTVSVFTVFLIAILALFVIQLFTFEYDTQGWLAPLANLLIGMGMLFVPTAMVIDEVRPYRALERSVHMCMSKSPLVIIWLIIGMVSLIVADGLLLWIIPHPFASWLVLLINSLFILPFLVVMLAQIYMSKYTILERN
jgi:hypothetical protein